MSSTRIGLNTAHLWSWHILLVAVASTYSPNFFNPLFRLKGFFIVKVFDLGTEVAHGDCNGTGGLKGVRHFLMGFSLKM
jgi:hypothetical protein